MTLDQLRANLRSAYNAADPETMDQLRARILSAYPEPDDAMMRQLRARLIARADQSGLLAIAYRTVDSPVGKLLIAATETGLVRLAFDLEGHDKVLSDLAQQISPRILEAPERLDQVARELDQYFAGTRHEFDLPLDLSLSHGFRRAVIERLRDIHYGRTASYGAIAALAGSPKAVRAVGSACATNPIPIVIPCHRVVRTDGTIGQYLGGTEAKRALLALEGAA